MPDISNIPKERLEGALREVRRDIARLHRDLGHGAGNEARWIFVVMWIALSNFLLSAFDLNASAAIGSGAFLVMTYRVIDGMRIRRQALQTVNDPVEPMWNTEVKL